jgi:hypothetical protein
VKGGGVSMGGVSLEAVICTLLLLGKVVFHMIVIREMRDLLKVQFTDWWKVPYIAINVNRNNLRLFKAMRCPTKLLLGKYNEDFSLRFIWSIVFVESCEMMSFYAWSKSLLQTLCFGIVQLSSLMIQFMLVPSRGRLFKFLSSLLFLTSFCESKCWTQALLKNFSAETSVSWIAEVIVSGAAFPEKARLLLAFAFILILLSKFVLLEAAHISIVWRFAKFIFVLGLVCSAHQLIAVSLHLAAG